MHSDAFSTTHTSTLEVAPSLRHAGKVALVTGGARGIGAGIVRRLASEGAHVVFTYASAAADATALVADVEARGGSASAIAANSGDREQVRQVVDTVFERHGRLDLLISNAGGGTIKQAAALSDPEIDRMIDVNIRGTVDVIRFSAPRMTAGGPHHHDRQCRRALPPRRRLEPLWHDQGRRCDPRARPGP